MTAAIRAPYVLPRHGAAVRAAHVLGVATAAVFLATGCRDVSRFSSRGDHFAGKIIAGEFVRTGLTDEIELCLLLDADHLQDAPGTLSTSDGLFSLTQLRPIPQIWHDPLSTMTFGEGRIQSLMYMATPNATNDGGVRATDVTVILSLMKSGDVEVRLLRSAPASPTTSATGPIGAAAGTSASSTDAAPPLFGVFPLQRKTGGCSF